MKISWHCRMCDEKGEENVTLRTLLSEYRQGSFEGLIEVIYRVITKVHKGKCFQPDLGIKVIGLNQDA